LARERRAAQVKEAFNLVPQSYKYSEEMLARKDIDGVMIATGDLARIVMLKSRSPMFFPKRRRPAIR
jgi:predicted dehydrogenase